MAQNIYKEMNVVGSAFISKPYGYEDVICNTPLYCGKLIYIHKRLNNHWHFHRNKDEVFRCLFGAVRVFYSWNDCKTDGVINYVHPDMHFIDLLPGDSLHIPPLLRHQFYALENSMLIEVSTHSSNEDSIYV